MAKLDLKQDRPGFIERTGTTRPGKISVRVDVFLEGFVEDRLPEWLYLVEDPVKILAIIISIPVTLPLTLAAVFIALIEVIAQKIKQLIRTRHQDSKIIDTPPGIKLLRLASFLCSPQSVELTFKSLVADLQSEYFDALKGRLKWKSRWIRVRYLYRFLMALGISKVLSLLRSVKSA